ncbi:hypothetical protein TNCV_3632821 [Trichonephila clavipes]|nr:hypothetical protein TNCV_3632821 [Trichonephila clavipes]
MTVSHCVAIDGACLAEAADTLEDESREDDQNNTGEKLLDSLAKEESSAARVFRENWWKLQDVTRDNESSYPWR